MFEQKVNGKGDGKCTKYPFENFVAYGNSYTCTKVGKGYGCYHEQQHEVEVDMPKLEMPNTGGNSEDCHTKKGSGQCLF